MENVVIIDCGSQFTQLIARRVREMNIHSVVLSWDARRERVAEFSPKGIIISGGPDSVNDPDAIAVDRRVLDMGAPVLGICYGMQLLAKTLGGAVGSGERSEYGVTRVRRSGNSRLMEGLPDELQVLMSHGDRVTSLPEGFRATASTEGGVTAAMEDRAGRFFGLQFHPEVAHTAIGTDILKNFIFNICGCEPSWTVQSFIETTVAAIRARVGQGKVICALSGGVDSSVTAALVHRAVGKQLTCIHVDTGLMRSGESDAVIRFFSSQSELTLVDIDASDFFLSRLRGVTSPEEKRRQIGHGFIEIFEREANKLGEVHFLAQGTLYPDVIESVTFRGKAPIKSHHNVGGLPERMRLELVEPLRDLFKDEVRLLGLELGLPKEAILRQPFPGPGLGIRIMGEITAERLAVLRLADAIVLEEMKNTGWYDKVWQSFAVLLPIRTVGVMGDSRTYEHVIALRAVDSRDAMTADWSRLPYEVLARISNRIINEVRGVNRVVYDISSKPPATIEWE